MKAFVAACAGVAALFVARSTGVAQSAGTDAVPTFARDVAPLIERRCASCHRPDGPAPFALASYEDAARRSAQIRDVVIRRYMPPWLPAQGGDTFDGARRLSDEEIALLSRWADAGAPAGDSDRRSQPGAAAEPPTPSGLGSPDLVVTLPAPYRLAADGPDIYRNFALPTGLTRAVRVRGVEIRPGNARAVHHAVLALDRGRVAGRLDALDAEPGYAGMLLGGAESPPGHFVGWAPGKDAVRAPDGLSWPLDADRDLVLQVHMVPTGKVETVRPSIAFHFTDETPASPPVLVRLGSMDIDIPAGARAHVVEDVAELPVALRVLAVSPHAHYLAREIRATAMTPDARRMMLLDIPGWNFRWQDDYRYRTPVSLPAGTQLTTRFVFDNSAGNPTNPRQPPRRVVYGPSTFDEMGDVWLQALTDSDEERARLERWVAGREREAQVVAYRRLAAAQPNDPFHRLTYGTILLESGKIADAIAQFDGAISIDRDFAMAYYNRAVALQRTGRLDDAAAAFRDAVARDGRYAEAEHGLGTIALARGDRREARRHFLRAVELWPEFAAAWTSLGTLQAGDGAEAEAIASFERALRSNPDHREALNNLGILLAKRGRIDAAVALFERAVRLYPDDAASRQNLDAARSLKR